MTIIYRVIEINNWMRAEYYKSLEGAAAAAFMQYKEYLLSADLLYTDGVDPADITAENIHKQLDELHTNYENWPTVTVAWHGVYTLMVTEVQLND